MSQPAYKAIFFDLDGTLLPLDMDLFIKRYFGALREFASEQGFDGDAFLEALLAATKAMTVEGEGTNADRFWSVFASLLKCDSDGLAPLLDDFYETRFDELGQGIVPTPESARIVSLLKEKGYPLYLTTMPFFPRIAVEKRLGWAGVPVDAFERITSYENSTSVKPYAAYYRENIKAAGVGAESILMVGNNTKEDLAALDLGVDGFLVTDCLLDPIGFDVESVKHGSLAEFLSFVEDLPECE